MSTNYLIHHGVKGQRWGERNYQNYDGTLTEAGRRRYLINIDRARSNMLDAKQLYKNAKIEYKTNKSSNNLKALNNAKSTYKYSKINFSDEKIKEKLNNEKRISNHRQKLIDKYKEKGYSDTDADIKAYKTSRNQKIAAAAVGAALTVAAAVVAKKQYDYRVDKIIKEGVEYKRVADGEKFLHDTFYMARGKDADKYVGAYGAQLRRNARMFGKEADITQRTLRVQNGGLKVAADNNARKVMESLYKQDSNFAKDAKEAINFIKVNSQDPKQKEAARKALYSLNKGVVDKNAYEGFNLALAYKDDKNQAANTFYKALKSKGYDAIKDVNDRKLSGYSAKSAKIVINKDKLKDMGTRSVSNEEIDRKLSKFITSYKNKENAKNLVGEIAPSASIYGTAAGAAAGLIAATINKNKAKAESSIVAEYKRKHPNTNLNYNQILENYYGK